jgi:hypothetical protein
MAPPGKNHSQSGIEQASSRECSLHLKDNKDKISPENEKGNYC